MHNYLTPSIIAKITLINQNHITCINKLNTSSIPNNDHKTRMQKTQDYKPKQQSLIKANPKESNFEHKHMIQAGKKLSGFKNTH